MATSPLTEARTIGADNTLHTRPNRIYPNRKPAQLATVRPACIPTVIGCSPSAVVQVPVPQVQGVRVTTRPGPTSAAIGSTFGRQSHPVTVLMKSARMRQSLQVPNGSGALRRAYTNLRAAQNHMLRSESRTRHHDADPRRRYCRFGSTLVLLIVALGCVPDGKRRPDDWRDRDGTAGSHGDVTATAQTKGTSGQAGSPWNTLSNQTGGVTGTGATPSATGSSTSSSGGIGGATQTTSGTVGASGTGAASSSISGGTTNGPAVTTSNPTSTLSGGNSNTSSNTSTPTNGGTSTPTGGTTNATGATSTISGGTSSTTGVSTTTACIGSKTYEFTGAEQQFVVPACAKTLRVQAYGASGGNAFNLAFANPVGGKGAYLDVTLGVPALGLADETLYIFVGGVGANGTTTAAGLGGWNGGGNGGYRRDSQNPPSWVAAAGGGGGATDLRFQGRALAQRLVAAAGGGGASGACTDDPPDNPPIPRPGGGDGGIVGGEDGDRCLAFNDSAGTGGDQDYGGLAGIMDANSGFACTAFSGVLGMGGSGCDIAGGGGGGGFYGGGGGAWGGGGGGSSFVQSGIAVTSAVGGEHTGAGRMILSWS